MSTIETVDTIVSNFNNNLKSVNVLLSDSATYKTETGGVIVDEKRYQTLQQYYTYLSNSINRLKEITDAENTLLSNNEQSLNDKNKDIDKYDLSLMNTKKDLEDKSKMLTSTEYQYELAIKRNNHRRQMVIMLAGLNTMGLVIYYLMSK